MSQGMQVTYKNWKNQGNRFTSRASRKKTQPHGHFDFSPVRLILGFSHSSVGKECPCNAGDLVSVSGSGRSLGDGNGKSFQYLFLPG